MKRPVLFCVILILILTFTAVLAEPLSLLEDYTNSVISVTEENDPSAGRFEYSYRYPHVDESAEGGAEINIFYTELMEYTDGFTIPMIQDAFEGENASTVIDYTVTCNNDDFFSVLIREERNNPDQSIVYWDAHVFSRKSGAPGQTYTLPKLLGILDANENDTWLQDRQTAKADRLIREMIWDMIEEDKEGIGYDSDLTEENLSHILFPEEQFYLNENGDPVFFLQPGDAAPESAGLVTFTIPLELILDEM